MHYIRYLLFFIAVIIFIQQALKWQKGRHTVTQQTYRLQVLQSKVPGPDERADVLAKIAELRAKLANSSVPTVELIENPPIPLEWVAEGTDEQGWHILYGGLSATSETVRRRAIELMTEHPLNLIGISFNRNAADAWRFWFAVDPTGQRLFPPPVLPVSVGEPDLPIVQRVYLPFLRWQYGAHTVMGDGRISIHLWDRQNSEWLRLVEGGFCPANRLEFIGWERRPRGRSFARIRDLSTGNEYPLGRTPVHERNPRAVLSIASNQTDVMLGEPFSWQEGQATLLAGDLSGSTIQLTLSTHLANIPLGTFPLEKITTESVLQANR